LAARRRGDCSWSGMMTLCCARGIRSTPHAYRCVCKGKNSDIVWNRFVAFSDCFRAPVS
jgi:hypothetical protein